MMRVGTFALEIRFGPIRVRPPQTLPARPNFWQRADAGECVQLFESRPVIPQLVAGHIAVWRGCWLAGGRRGRRRRRGRGRGENDDDGRGGRAEKNNRVVTRPADVRIDTTVLWSPKRRRGSTSATSGPSNARWTSFSRSRRPE
jgi:hypothetical protein